MRSRYGVIDLGTNTFHLLVAEQQADGRLKTLHRQRIFVALAEDGIEAIGDAPYARGLAALQEFRKILDDLAVKQVRAFGTAALRTASNGPEFVITVENQLGIQIQLIPGNEEARLIHLGVAQAVPFDQDYSLIMDIGGGSVEFIIANQKGVVWSQSFPIGVAVLFQKFHHQDPIATNEVDQLIAFLHSELAPLLDVLKQYPAKVLIGASGTFDVLENLLASQRHSDIYSSFEVAQFDPFYQRFLFSTLAERLRTEGIPDSRAELLVVALVLIHFVLKATSIQQVAVSAYAMKEGILQEMVEA